MLPGRRKRWFVLFLLYTTILALDLLIIELRRGPIWYGGSMANRMPLLAATFNWVFRPDLMHYVAMSDLKANQKLTLRDLTYNQQLSPVLRGYVPRNDELVGKYLANPVAAGQPIFAQNLSQSPAIKPESKTGVIDIRVAEQPKLREFLTPNSKVQIVAHAHNEHLNVEGTILTGLQDDEPSPVPTRKSEGEARKLNPTTNSGQPTATPPPDPKSKD
jgi:hypothetical protein